MDAGECCEKHAQDDGRHLEAPGMIKGGHVLYLAWNPYVPMGDFAVLLSRNLD